MQDDTVYLKDYQPFNFSIDTISLEFDLYNDKVLVTNIIHIRRKASGPLVLNGYKLKLLELYADNKAIKPTFEQDNLIINDCPDQCKLTIKTAIFPHKNTALSGLYWVNGLFCTQCEAQGFRRITFYPDRPDVLTVYQTKIIADKSQYPILLSNGNLVDKGELANNRHWVSWQDPFKKPSYLFALVAGNLAWVEDYFTTQSGKLVSLQVYVDKGNQDKCAHAIDSLKKAMRWDEQVYGREYDLSTFMIVAVNDFNMGAMENKGLNVFNAKYILAHPDTATDEDFAAIENVVAHEYFHNWTGNRITCRDWFQLSIKEGLTVFRDQEFSRDMNSRGVNRIQDVKALRNAQFPEDAGAMQHPVQPNSYQKIDNFYTATVYDKGAEVIRMLQTLLGDQCFSEGMTLYFDRYDGQAVTIDDFLAVMQETSGQNLQAFKRWYTQAGTPKVQVESDYSNKHLTLTFKQIDLNNNQPFVIPVQTAFFDSKAQLISSPLLTITESQQTFTFNNIDALASISLLRDFSAPIILQQDLSQSDLLGIMQVETDAYAKWQASQTLYLSTFSQWFNQKADAWQLPQSLHQVFIKITHQTEIEPALIAELLTLPSIEELLTRFKNADVTVLETARQTLYKQMGNTLWPDLVALYQKLWQREDHAFNALSYQRRKLRNHCLNLMMRADELKALAYCHPQFSQAKTMTDKVASLALLNNCHNETLRDQALKEFYHRWASNDLVLDKWFAIQADCYLPRGLTVVKKLLHHADFTIKNPNRLRALISSFCQNNTFHFHAIEGQGYALLTDIIQQVDRINPQVAARLTTPFTRWQRYDTHRQRLMQNQLETLAKDKLSKDVRELVLKSLEKQ